MSRIKIKLNEIIGKYTSLVANNNLAKCEDYADNELNFSRCFSQRLVKSLEDDKIERICKAYNLAISDNYDRDMYYISDEWIPVYEKYMGEIISALKEKQIFQIKDNYDNFYRRNCSAGLVGLPTNMKRFYEGDVGWIDKRWYLNDSFYRLNYLKNKIEGLNLKSLGETTYGNPYGVMIDGQFIRNGADYQYFYAEKIKQLCTQSEFQKKRVVEIGGGYGGVASFLMKSPVIDQYIDYDLPENLALATYVLMTIYPAEEFVLYGEEGSSTPGFNGKRFVMMPAHSIENLQVRDISVGFNSFSFSEMSFKTAKNYIDLLSQAGVNYLYHVNHVRNSRTSADQLLPGNGYVLDERIAANWNLGRSTTCDEFEFLYRRVS